MGKNGLSAEVLRKFGHPDATIRTFAHWVLILKYKQWTLGCMILLCTEKADELWSVSSEALQELPIILQLIDQKIRPVIGYKRLNFFRIGNIDPEMHFHLMPRYEGDKYFGGLVFPDRGWPRGPDFTVTLLDEYSHIQLLSQLQIALR